MRMAFRILLLESLLGVLLFTSAGRLDLPWFWAMLAVHGLMVSIMMYLIPGDLRQERMRPGPGERDRHLRLLLIPPLLLHLVVAGLDARFGWSPDPGPLVRAIGLGGIVVSLAVGTWAMYVNRFFSCAVRLQSDRGHHVVTEGPYRYVRHPGYAGSLCCAIAANLALGSFYALLPLVPAVVIMAVRVVREERFLREVLAGYAAYMDRVRYRLV